MAIGDIWCTSVGLKVRGHCYDRVSKLRLGRVISVIYIEIISRSTVQSDMTM